MAGWLTGDAFVPRPTAPPACPTTRSDRDFYGAGTANPPTAVLETAFTLLGRTGDVSTNMSGNGANNQRFPDAGRTIVASDALDRCVEVYNAVQVEPHARVLGRYTTTSKDGIAVNRLTDGVATGVAPDATLENLDPHVTWSAAYLHVGLEGLNSNRGQLSAQTALGLLHDFVADSVSVSFTHKVTADRVAFTAKASSARGARDHEVPLGLRRRLADRRDDRPDGIARVREGIPWHLHGERGGREHAHPLGRRVSKRPDHPALAPNGVEGAATAPSTRTSRAVLAQAGRGRNRGYTGGPRGCSSVG